MIMFQYLGTLPDIGYNLRISTEYNETRHYVKA